MEAGVPTMTADDSRFQIVENDLPWTSTEEAESIRDTAIEVGLPLCQAKLDVAEPAVTQHGNQDGNSS